MLGGRWLSTSRTDIADSSAFKTALSIWEIAGIARKSSAVASRNTATVGGSRGIRFRTGLRKPLVLRGRIRRGRWIG